MCSELRLIEVCKISGNQTYLHTNLNEFNEEVGHIEIYSKKGELITETFENNDFIVNKIYDIITGFKIELHSKDYWEPKWFSFFI